MATFMTHEQMERKQFTIATARVLLRQAEIHLRLYEQDKQRPTPISKQDFPEAPKPQIPVLKPKHLARAFFSPY